MQKADAEPGQALRLYSSVDRWLFNSIPSAYGRAAYAKANFALFRKLKLIAPVSIETRHHFRMRLDKVDRVAGYVYYFGIWEPQVSTIITRLVGSGDIVIDVGAHVGHHTLLAAQAVGPRGRVYAFEASPDTYARLQANVALNHADNVDARHVAVCAETGSITLFTGSHENSLRTSIASSDYAAGQVRVPCCRLDDLLTELDPARVRLLKVDVEGAELDLLKGARGLFAALPQDAAVLLEVAAEDDGKHIDGRSVLDHFSAQGFQAFAINNDYSAVSYDAPLRLTRVADLRGAGLIDVLFARGTLVDRVAEFIAPGA